MIRIGICDDEQAELQKVRGYVENWLDDRYDYSISCFNNPMELMSYTDKKGGFDLLLLDVYMPQLLGTEIAKELRKKGDQSRIVFLTSSRNHAIDAFAVRASDYLLKPIKEESLIRTLEEIIPAIYENESKLFTVKTADGIINIEYNSILYIELNERRLNIYTTDGRLVRSVILRGAFEQEISPLIDDSRFVHCQKSYIVNMNHVRIMENDRFKLRDDQIIPISKRMYQDTKKKYMTFLLREEYRNGETMHIIEYLQYAAYVLFVLVFILMTVKWKISTGVVILTGALSAAAFTAGGYWLYTNCSAEYFDFFFPVTGLVIGGTYTVYVAEYEGQKAIFNFPAAIFFVTIAETAARAVALSTAGSNYAYLAVEFIVFISIMVIREFFTKSFYETIMKYNDSGWGMLDMAIIIYLFVIYMMTMTTGYEKMLPIRIGLEVIMLVGVIAIFVFAGKTLQNQENQHNYTLLKEQAKSWVKQVEELSQNEKQISILRHDMRHKINIVSQLVEEGHYGEALNVLDNTDKELEKSRPEKYCEKIYINSVLIMHRRTAENCRMSISYNMDIPEAISVNVYELSVVVSNLIENAINACLKIPDREDRYIIVKARSTENNLVLEIVNSCIAKAETDKNGMPVTDREGHGIGVISVETFVNKYNGMLDFTAEEDRFTARVLVNYY